MAATSPLTPTGDPALTGAIPMSSSIRASWRAETLLACAFAVIMLGTSVPTPMYALYSEHMHFTALTTTIVYATFTPGALFGLLVCGRWSDAVGRRPMLLASLTCALVSALRFVTAETVAHLLEGRALSGLSAGLAMGAATAAVIEAAPPSRRHMAAAVATVANTGGVALGQVLTGLLVQFAPHPLRLPLILQMLLILLAGAAVLAAEETSPRTVNLAVQRLSVPKPVRPLFVTAAIAAFAGFAVIGAFGSIGPSLLSNVHGVSNHAVAGAIAGSASVASAVAQVVGRHVKPRRAVASGCVGLVIGAVIVAVSLWNASVSMLFVGAVVAGTGQGLGFSRGLAAVAERTPPDRRAEISSAYFTIAYIGMALPVIGQGLAAHAWGLRTAGVVFALAAAGLSAVCLAAILMQDAHRWRGETCEPPNRPTLVRNVSSIDQHVLPMLAKVDLV
jgi:MFS family permease